MFLYLYLFSVCSMEPPKVTKTSRSSRADQSESLSLSGSTIKYTEQKISVFTDRGGSRRIFRVRFDHVTVLTLHIRTDRSEQTG